MVATLPLSRQWLERTYLQGVDLTDDNGNPFPDALYRLAFKAAADNFKMKTHVILLPTEFVERHDYTYNRALQYHFLRLNRRPILRQPDLDPPRKVALRYVLGKDAHVYDIEDNWILEVIPEAGQVQILPIARDAASYPITPSGRWFGVISTGIGGNLPGWYEATYWAGFPEGDLLLIHDLVTELTNVLEGHRKEVRGDPAIHGAVDTANALTAHGGSLEYYGESLDEAMTQGNAIKGGFNGHGALIGSVHGKTDTVNVITSDDATDLTTLCTLLNEARSVVPSHLLEAAGEPSVHGNQDLFRTVAAGPVRDDFVQLPGSILHCISMLAAMFVLNPAGDLIAGAGIANLSVGIDALHQTIGTTSSATNAGYGARIIQYTRDLKALLPSIRRYYYGFSMR